jgi:HD superfamily phosphohydrolase
MKKILSFLLGIFLLIGIFWGAYWLLSEIWGQFKSLDTNVAVAALTAFTTVTVSTLTVVLGKYYERKKDIEAHYRQKKTEIYDEFLKEFFKAFYSEADKEDDAKQKSMIDFLREWQRKMVLWGGQNVLIKYIKWMTHLKKGNPDAATIFLMEDFFREIRKDLGHKNNKLEKGTFAHLILQNAEIFLEMAKKNPNVTFAELAEAENALQSIG